MSKNFYVECRDDSGTLTKDSMIIINSDNGANVYPLSSLMTGIVLVDNTDQTTGWKIVVSKTGVISTTQVTVS